MLTTDGDEKFQLHQCVECILVFQNLKTNCAQIQIGAGEITVIHREAVLDVSIDLNYDAAGVGGLRGRPAPPLPLSRVIGYDLKMISPLPWEPSEIPPYYRSPNQEVIFVPRRHVIRVVTKDAPLNESVGLLLNSFFRRAPYGWLVLHHEASLEDTPHEVKGKILQRKSRRTRRVVGEVVDFGMDYDGVPKLVCRNMTHFTPNLESQFHHGSFSEVAQRYPNENLFKLPYTWVHDVFDQVTLGPQTYYSVVKHLICDKLQRFRVKTVKESNDFYYGFTQDGFHFSKARRRILDVNIPPLPIADEEPWEIRKSLDAHHWFQMVPGNDDRPVRRGYIIYGRIVECENGRTTLEWCNPPAGVDLLRVYLATEGNSAIFQGLSTNDILEKMRDKGEETIASKLFLGLVDLNAQNDAIEYVYNQLLWEGGARHTGALGAALDPLSFK